MLLSIIRESTVSTSQLRSRLGLTLQNHSISSSGGTIQATRDKSGFSWGENITCNIFVQDEGTILQIKSDPKSTGFNRTSYFDGPQHNKNINRLYNELIFRLEAESLQPLQAMMIPEKNILEKITPVEFKGVQCDYLLTESKVLIIKNDLVYKAIERSQVIDYYSKRELTNEGMGFIYLGAIFLTGLVILWIVLGTVFGPFGINILSLSQLALIVPGIILLTIGILVSLKLSIIIQEHENTTQIYSKRRTILRILKGLKSLISPLERQLDTQFPTDSGTLSESSDSLKVPPPLRQAKECVNCGAKIPDDQLFCGKCGTSL